MFSAGPSIATTRGEFQTPSHGRAASSPAGIELQLPRWVFPALIVAGIMCRVVQYLWNSSFWVDEASLVLNIRTKTAAQLLGPLDYHQAAPPLFLLIERGICRLLGPSEWSLRLIPMLAGCIAVVLFAAVARRLLSPWAATIALALFCFSDRLIGHAVEVKQYGIDVFIATALLFIATAPVAEGRRPMMRLAALALGGAVAVWFSYPSIFVFAGLSLALAPLILSRGWRAWLMYGILNLIVAASFLTLLLTVIRIQQSGALEGYWAEDFIDFHHPLGVPIWLGRHLLSLCNYPTQPLGVLVLPFAVIGVIGLLQVRQFLTLALLLNPIGISLVAAAAGRYPFDGARLTVYLTPAVLLLAGAGAISLYLWLRKSIGWIGLAPAGIMVAIAGGSAAVHLFVPQERGHVRRAAEFVAAHAGPDQAIYALQPNEFRCYWPPEDPRVYGEIPRADAIASREFWIVCSYPNATARRRLDPLLGWLDSFAACRQSYSGDGCCAYLFQMTSKSPPHSAPPNILSHHKQMAP
jgi:hypothetical protein